MTSDQIVTIIIAAISGGLFTFLSGIIEKIINKKNEQQAIMNKLSVIELSSTRSELLIMMNHYKSDRSEIMRLAEKYFGELKGDFYMSSIFSKWLKKNDMEKPSWFTEE